MRVARRVKSLSLETRQKPPNSRVCSKSIASMMSALSLAFLPTVLRNCWTGWIACSSNTVRQPCRFVVVKSPIYALDTGGPERRDLGENIADHGSGGIVGIDENREA